MDKHTNFAYSTIATAPSPASSGTSLVVASGEGALFPTVPFNCVIWPVGSNPLSTNAEIVRVTNISGDTFTIIRSQESSSARSIIVGDQICAAITAKTFTDIEIPVGTYSTRIALTPFDGMEFFQTDDGRDAPAGKYFYLNSGWNYVNLREEALWYWFDDFGGTIATYRGMVGVGSNFTGSGNNVEILSSSFGTGSSATGSSLLRPGASSAGTTLGFRASTQNFYYKIQITTIPTLSTASQEYMLEFGFTANSTQHPGNIGYLFNYDRLTSTNWLYRNGNGALTDSTVAVAAATSYLLEIFVTSSTVTYWINGSQIASEAINNNTTFVTPIAKIIKSAGTTSRTFEADYLKVWSHLATPRS